MQLKPVEDFAKNRNKSDGLQVCCRVCKKEIDARHYSQNKVSQKEL